jgi:hypothetical protein
VVIRQNKNPRVRFLRVRNPLLFLPKLLAFAGGVGNFFF